LCKNIPVPVSDQIKYADLVSSKIWTAYPWKETKTYIKGTTPPLIPLVNNQQDYSTPFNIYLLTKGSLVRTDTTPEEHVELEVVQETDVDMIARSPYAI